jgi:CheY-like chemotaxis protein
MRGATDVFAPVLAGRSVLLVDDNATNLRILSLQLERLGMRCTPASSGEEALAVVKNGFEYDVAVLDMNMPDMTGFDLGRHLTDLPGRPSAAPLVLLTSLGWRSDGAEHVFTAILSKPVKSAHLRDTLTECLAGGRSVRAAVAQTPEPESEVAARRILLAEDNPVNQRVAQLMLRDLGHEVDVVANGAAAVKAVEQHDYDVVLMDVQMPVMDGLEATRQIRTGVPRGRQPHIVALTASALVEDREACADAGMEAYLTKPIRKGDLQAMLQHASLSGQV